jgi:acetyltransferase-like isoleucine patch superfamily enzyme
MVDVKNITKKPTDLQYQFWYLLRGIYKVLTGNWNFDTYIDGRDVFIGKDVAIGPGVKIITNRHNTEDIWTWDDAKPVHIGDRCWIGANAVILPGVSLGPHTVVGAGAIVTKSFPHGYCVIVGNPAKKIKDLKLKNMISGRVSSNKPNHVKGCHA